MLWIVLPLATLSARGPIANSVSIAAVYISVFIEIILVINVDVAVVPIAITPIAAGPGTQRKSGRAPRKPHAGVVPGLGIRIIGVGRRRRSVNDRRIV
jgi:hypothetical protein